MGKDDNIFNINDFKKQQGNQPQPQITRQDVIDAPDVGCVNCGGELFLPATRFKRLSKLLTGAAQDQLINLQTMVCANCGWEFGQPLPEEEGGHTGLEDMDTGNEEAEQEPDTAFDDIVNEDED